MDVFLTDTFSDEETRYDNFGEDLNNKILSSEQESNVEISSIKFPHEKILYVDRHRDVESSILASNDNIIVAQPPSIGG